MTDDDREMVEELRLFTRELAIYRKYEAWTVADIRRLVPSCGNPPIDRPA